MIFGVDVSHHQNPTALDWDGMAAKGCRFCIVRHTNGMVRDRHAPEHVRRARAAGMRVGAYHFFRASQPILEQFRAFQEAALATGYGRSEDIAPALDLEDHTESEKIDAFPNYADLAHELADKFMVSIRSPLLYLTQRDWRRVGAPQWMLAYDLWVAHYFKPGQRTGPATPGDRAFAIHQHRVGKFDPEGPPGFYDEPAQIDQNRAAWLPLISGERLTETPRAEQQTLPDVAAHVAAIEAAQSSGAELINADRAAALSEADTDPAPPPEGEDIA